MAIDYSITDQNAHVDPIVIPLPSDLNAYCRGNRIWNRSCRQCLKRTLEALGIDADAYDREAIHETARRRSKAYRKSTYIPGDPDNANANRQRNYGITPQQYNTMLTAQHKACVLCGNPETRIHKSTRCALAVDHDHVTGQVRGLLCASCNQIMGHLEKKGGDWAGKAEAYLAYHAGQPHLHGPWCPCTATAPPPTPPRPPVPRPYHATHTVDAELAHRYQICQRCYGPSDSAYCSDACATGDRDAMRTRWR